MPSIMVSFKKSKEEKRMFDIIESYPNKSQFVKDVLSGVRDFVPNPNSNSNIEGGVLVEESTYGKTKCNSQYDEKDTREENQNIEARKDGEILLNVNDLNSLIQNAINTALSERVNEEPHKESNKFVGSNENNEAKLIVEEQLEKKTQIIETNDSTDEVEEIQKSDKDKEKEKHPIMYRF